MSVQIQYVPFSSSINPIFWSRFNELKLDKLCLSTEPVTIKALYSNRIINGVPPLLSLGYDALSSEISAHPGEFVADGTLINTNTIEDFKNRDKSKLLSEFASKYIWDSINSGEAEHDPSTLNSFILFMFADLKKYIYYYWFAFPALSIPSFVVLKKKPRFLNSTFDDKLVLSILESCTKDERKAFFTLVLDGNDDCKVLPLSDYPKCKAESKEGQTVFLCFADPCNDSEFPGWPLRNLLTLAATRWPLILDHSILCVREHLENGKATVGCSLVLEVKIEQNLTADVLLSMPSCVGWERNERGKLGPRSVNLKSSMDPASISESAVSLNLQLMRWRLAPDLDLNSIKKSRCLLFGAGTLGCNVARCLMGWGIKKITFVDCGQVMYSNPVRQSLFTFEHAKSNDRNKAEVAAEVLKDIYPGVQSSGFVTTIPMPGHSVGEQQGKAIIAAVHNLTELVKSHDVLFLLTDSRESRWLPTVLGTVHKKLILTAALGFDSFLVMRHGMQPDATDNLGCYFCNDVVAPGDSTSDRSLDQQCTVTRPGMSLMAAGHVVEMMVSAIQLGSELRSKAKTTVGDGACSSKLVNYSGPESSIGIVPHSVRYYYGRLHQLATHTESFANCSACGSEVLRAFRERGFDFVLDVCNSTTYLEDVCGLSQLHKDSNDAEIWEISDSEEDEENESETCAS